MEYVDRELVKKILGPAAEDFDVVLDEDIPEGTVYIKDIKDMKFGKTNIVTDNG